MTTDDLASGLWWCAAYATFFAGFCFRLGAMEAGCFMATVGIIFWQLAETAEIRRTDEQTTGRSRPTDR